MCNISGSIWLNKCFIFQALDNYVISDEEIIEDAMFGGIFAAKHQDFRVMLYHHTPDVRLYLVLSEVKIYWRAKAWFWDIFVLGQSLAVVEARWLPRHENSTISRRAVQLVGLVLNVQALKTLFKLYLWFVFIKVFAFGDLKKKKYS
jgi:hypothetical protein